MVAPGVLYSRCHESSWPLASNKTWKVYQGFTVSKARGIASIVCSALVPVLCCCGSRHLRPTLHWPLVLRYTAPPKNNACIRQQPKPSLTLDWDNLID